MAGYSELMRYQRAEPPLKLDGPAAARSFFSGCFAEQDPRHESLWVVHLDGQARCLHVSRHDGDRGGVGMPVRSIVLDAARHGSAAVLLAHNHPSGDPSPSESDLNSTRQLAAVFRALGCRLVDHLIFAGDRCASLSVLGYL